MSDLEKIIVSWALVGIDLVPELVQSSVYNTLEKKRIRKESSIFSHIHDASSTLIDENDEERKFVGPEMS